MTAERTKLLQDVADAQRALRDLEQEEEVARFQLGRIERDLKWGETSRSLGAKATVARLKREKIENEEILRKIEENRKKLLRFVQDAEKRLSALAQDEEEEEEEGAADRCPHCRAALVTENDGVRIFACGARIANQEAQDADQR